MGEFYEIKDCKYAFIKEDASDKQKIPRLYRVSDVDEISGSANIESKNRFIGYGIRELVLFDSVDSAVEYCISRDNNRLDVAREFIEQRPELESELISIIAKEIDDLD